METRHSIAWKGASGTQSMFARLTVQRPIAKVKLDHSTFSIDFDATRSPISKARGLWTPWRVSVQKVAGHM